MECPAGTFFQNPNFGLSLGSIKKITDNNLLQIKQNTIDSFAWMIKAGRATAVDCIVEQDTLDFTRVDIKVSVTQPNGIITTYTVYKRLV